MSTSLRLEADVNDRHINIVLPSMQFLLAGCQSEHQACENSVMTFWCGYQSGEVQMVCSAYHITSLKPMTFLPFWCQLT